MFTKCKKPELIFYCQQTTCLCFGQTELRCEFDSFRCGQVLLNVEPFLESVELRITKHRSRFATATVFRQVIDRTDCRSNDARASSTDVMQQTM